MSNEAKLELEGKVFDLPTVVGTEGERAVDVSALRANTVRSAEDMPAVRPRKNGAASKGLTIGNKPANVRRKAVSTSFTVSTLCAVRGRRGSNQ